MTETFFKTFPIKRCLLLFGFLVCSCSQNNSNNTTVTELRTEYLIEPLGIDSPSPRFSWQLKSPEKGILQNAYELEVSTTDGQTVWATGKISSDEQHNINYKGDPLKRATRYSWKVKVWNQKNIATPWSIPSFFETGLQDNEQWQANWIFDGKPTPENPEAFYKDRPNPIFRKEFDIADTIASARLFIAGLGYYEAYLNGEKIGDRVLEPGWTNYGKELLYSTYDVTEQLHKGENVIGVSLGNGWYNPLPLRLFGKFNLREYLSIGSPKVLAELHLTFKDGSKKAIATDTTWTTGEGAILRNDVYLGEKIDARRHQKNWNKIDFDDRHWQASQLAEAPKGKLLAQRIPPIKKTKELRPIAITEPQPKVYVIDFGQNMAGWMQMDLSAKSGQNITFKYGELLQENGLVNVNTSVAGQIKEWFKGLDGGAGAPVTAFQEDTYIAKGKNTERFCPTFTFHGFRYVEIRGYDKKPNIEDLKAFRLASNVEQAGTFECSNELFNDIQQMTNQTFKSNLFSVQSDCPAREKFGYGADIITTAEAFSFNYWMPNFYEKTVRDFANDQRPNGGMTETAPYNGIDSKGLGEGSGPIGWQLAHPFLQEKLYEFYGDEQIIMQQYPNTVNLMTHLEKAAGDNHYIELGIGDHVSLTPKAIPLTSTAFYYHNVKLAERFAGILGKTSDSLKYSGLSKAIKKAFIDRFYDSKSKKFDSLVTQANQVFPLYYDLVSEAETDEVKEVLLKDITDQNRGHLNTGIFATKMLFDVLREFDENTIAYNMVNTKEYPGYGFMVEQGATTLWESWAYPKENSANHPMFGSVSEWFFRSVLGINQAESSVAFKHILIQPRITEQLKWAKGSYRTLPGTIKVSWKREDAKFFLDVTIPHNTTATLAIPITLETTEINEKNGYLWKTNDAEKNNEFIRFIQRDKNYAYFKVRSGTYSFSSR